MGFFSDYIKPSTHTVRNSAHAKPLPCRNPKCNKKAKDDHGTCGRIGCMKFAVGSW